MSDRFTADFNLKKRLVKLDAKSPCGLLKSSFSLSVRRNVASAKQINNTSERLTNKAKKERKYENENYESSRV